MRKLALPIGLAIGILLALFINTAYAAPNSTFQVTMIPGFTNTYDLGSSARNWRKLYIRDLKFATSTSGCAQISTVGTLFSTGVDCGGGGGTPALPFNSVQFNDAGSFAGSSLLRWITADAALYIGAENNAGGIFGVSATTADTTGGGLQLFSGDGNGAANGGAVAFGSGEGGDTGNGGPIEVTAGPGGATSGSGGSISVTAGSGQGTETSGGKVDIKAGDADNTGAIGAHIQLFQGLFDGGYFGGGFELSGGGVQTGSGDGGGFTATGGQGGPTSGDGGSVSFTAGSAQAGDSDGGSVSITGGSPSGTGGGGYVQVGSPTKIQFNTFNGANVGSQLGIALTSNDSFNAYLSTDTLTAEHLYTFPDFTGTLVLFVTAPATAADTCTAGMVAYDATHFYVCQATDSWVRTSMAAW